MSEGGSPSPLRRRQLVVLGFRGVGKSSLVFRFINGSFPTSYTPTIEAAHVKRLRLKGSEHEITIRDTPGQDELVVFSPRNCLGVHGFVLCYSVTSRYSFDVLTFIHDRLLTSMLGSSDNITCVLIGNKVDMERERQVSEQEGRDLAASWGCRFFECSAKHDEGIREAFIGLLEDIDSDSGVVQDSTGCCEAMKPQRNLDERVQRRLSMAVSIMSVLMALLGAWLLVDGVYYGLHNSGDSTLLTYGAVGAGLFIFVAAAAGVWGARQYSQEALKFNAFALLMVVTTLVIGAAALSATPDGAKARLFALVGALIGLPGITLACYLQYGLESEDDADDPSHYRHIVDAVA
eukprot:PLAT12595.2.p1 GENE.PLAT12595.2~~PLAT12595.2.p1  ORF type:complete len:348 (+),score=115.30 PLAT12595.2:59-1102(+)